MSNPYSRYREIYKRVPRANSITPFSKHVFMRSQNKHVNKIDRLGDRTDPFESTFVHLTERFNNTELFLIGTMNTSTMLARRTRKLIRDIKPDAVMVMCSPEWWDISRLIEGVHSQEDFNEYHEKYLSKVDHHDLDTSWFRGTVFWLRMALLNATLRYVYRPGDHFKFYYPGLEIKYACEEAERMGSELHFLGPELNKITWNRLYHDTRFNVPETLVKGWNFTGTRWSIEHFQQHQKLQLTTPSQYVETCCDEYNINWYIKSMEMLFPSVKSVLIDKRDMALYKYITKNTQHKRIVAVVNQWHMEGIEHLWAHEFGQLPRSQKIAEEIDPIGDMNLHEGLFDLLYNAFQRQLKNAHSKTTPASYSNMMNTYHREQNWQYEHRNM